jgi:hypothetical protein
MFFPSWWAGNSAQTNANVRTWILDATDESPKGRNSCLALNTFSKKCVKDSKQLFFNCEINCKFSIASRVRIVRGRPHSALLNMR